MGTSKTSGLLHLGAVWAQFEHKMLQNEHINGGDGVTLLGGGYISPQAPLVAKSTIFIIAKN